MTLTFGPNDMPTVHDLVVETIGTKRSVFLCGAGVSFRAGVPIVASLLDEIGKLAELDLQEIQAMKRIQFEYLFTRIREAVGDDVNGLMSIFRGEKPGLAHEVIAGLHREGIQKYLFTTNFDLNFEAAFQAAGVAHTLIYKSDDFSHFLDLASSSSLIVKLHGSAHDLPSMRVFAENVASSYQLNLVRRPLSQILSERKGRILIIIGYSMSDRFDVVPALEEIERKGTQIIYWEHQDRKEPTLDSDKYEQFINGHSRKIFGSGDTDYLLRKISETFNMNVAYDNFVDGDQWRGILASWWNSLPHRRQHRVRGAIFLALGRPNKALASLEQALTEDDQPPFDLSCSVAMLLNDNKRYERASEILDSILKACPQNQRAPRILAWLEKSRIAWESQNEKACFRYVFLAHAELTKSYGAVNSLQKEVYPHDPEAYLWVHWLYASSRLESLRGNEIAALQHTEAAADIADRGGLLHASHYFEAARAHRATLLAIKGDDERQFQEAVDRLNRNIRLMQNVFDPDDASIQQSIQTIKWILDLAHRKEERGWTLFRQDLLG